MDVGGQSPRSTYNGEGNDTEQKISSNMSSLKTRELITQVFKSSWEEQAIFTQRKQDVKKGVV